MPHEDPLLRQIRERVDHPATTKELLRLLDIPRDARTAFKRQLRSLVASGALVEVRGHRFGLADQMHLVAGKLSINPRGFGFVEPDPPIEDGPPSLYIASNNLNQAMHGDRVVARIERGSDGRDEGRVLRILERAAERFVGRFERDDSGRASIVPFDRRLTMEVHVPHAETRGAAAGEMVAAQVMRWPTETRAALARVTDVFGPIDAPGVDVSVVIRKFNLPDAHGDEAVAEAARLGGEVRERDLAGRTDFRSWATVTIDGEHARDFDDALSIDRLDNGNFWLAVHIADVAHYVPEGGALDREAYDRSTSVYFPDRAVHMFPSELSTGLCSLKPQVDRLVQSCVMEVDRRTGAVVRYELHDGVIHSDARMTYTDVNAILTDRDPEVTTRHESLVPMFERLREVFEVLHARRRRRGSIDFDLKESEIVLDDAGAVEAVVAAERNVAHRIVEECMLLANETIASHLERHDVPTLYRIHESPDPAKVEIFEDFISTLGHTLGGPAGTLEPRAFQRLVDRIHGTPEEKPIAFLLLRTMQKARYDPVNVGHFGLAAECYTHFTSPIRRYPDLVVHRVLRESRRGMSDERRAELVEDLPDVGRHTSERERRASEAERELVQWKKVRFMADKVGDEFEGFVTGVGPMGLFIELIEHFVEGLVHVSTMADDYYRLDERAHLLRGDRHDRVFRLGDRVAVQVIRVDLERRQIDLGLVEILEAVRGGAPSKARGGAIRAKGKGQRAEGRAKGTGQRAKEGDEGKKHGGARGEGGRGATRAAPGGAEQGQKRRPPASARGRQRQGRGRSRRGGR